MFQERRTFASCVFCGSRDLSREHLFGKSFADFLELKTTWIVHLPDGQLKKGSSPLTNIAPRMLCQACNSGLSQVMSGSLPALKAMASGTRVEQFTRAELDALTHYFERLGFLLDAYTSNYELEVNTAKVQEEARAVGRLRTISPMFSNAERAEWIQHMSPQERIHVYVGHHPGVLGLIVPFHISNFDELQRGGTGEALLTLAGKRFALVLKHLAICIEVGQEFFGRPKPNSFHNVRTLQGWPPVPAVSYLNFYDLPNPMDPHIQQQIAGWSDPIQRMAAEAWVKRMNGKI